MKRIYIAAPWAQRDYAREVAAAFVDAGFQITEEWWNHKDVPATINSTEHLKQESDALSTEALRAELLSQAEKDFDGILTADLFVLLNTQPRGQETSGKAVETGIALMCCLPIVAVGEPSNVFHVMDDFTWVTNIEEAIKVCQNL